jgi:hypothetical protein
MRGQSWEPSFPATRVTSVVVGLQKYRIINRNKLEDNPFTLGASSSCKYQGSAMRQGITTKRRDTPYRILREAKYGGIWRSDTSKLIMINEGCAIMKRAAY